MSLEELCRKKSDEELREAAAQVEEYTEEARQVIHAELRRRGFKSQTKSEAIEESAKAYFDLFRDNPFVELKEGDIVHWLICPSCGMNREQRTGHADFPVLGKDASGFIYLECPGCAKHLQYDPMTGTIKTQGGLLGFFFGIFR